MKIIKLTIIAVSTATAIASSPMSAPVADAQSVPGTCAFNCGPWPAPPNPRPSPPNPSPSPQNRRPSQPNPGPTAAEIAEQQRKAAALNLNNQGIFFEGLKDYNSAAQYFERALAADPTNPVIRANLASARSWQGTAFYDQGDYARAVDFYQQGVDLNPDDALLSDDLARAKAAQAQQQAQQEKEKQHAAAVMANKSGLDAEKKGDLDGAIKYYQQALNLAPTDGNIKSNLDRAVRNRDQQANDLSQTKEADRGLVKGVNRILNDIESGTKGGPGFDSGPKDSIPFGGPQDTHGAPSPVNELAFGPATCGDASTVCLKDAKTLVVNPGKVKGPPDHATPEGVRPIAPADLGLAALPEDIMRIMFEQYNLWPGPANPEAPLINPLREPERYKTYVQQEITQWSTELAGAKDDATKQRLQDLIEHSERSVRSLNGGRSPESEAKLQATIQGIWQKEKEAEAQATHQAAVDGDRYLEALVRTSGSKDLFDLQTRSDQDPYLRKTIGDTLAHAMEKQKAAQRAAYDDALDEEGSAILDAQTIETVGHENKTGSWSDELR